MPRFSVLFPLLFISANVFSADFFPNRGGHALTALFGVPAALTNEGYLDENRPRVGVNLGFSHVNMFAGGVAEDEVLVLDAERTELVFSHSFQLGSCYYSTVKLPFVAYGGGVLDGFIENWHEVFSLPDGDRDESPRYQVNIAYNDPEGNSFKLEKSEYGIGDINLELVRPLRCQRSRLEHLLPAVRLGLKLPTGDDEKLMGSGATDLYLDIRSSLLMLNSWAFRAGIGVLVTGESDLFSNQEHLVLFGKFLTAFQYSGNIDLLAQIDWHSPLFDSELVELGENSIQLTFGGAIKMSGQRSLELALQEDLTPDTSPDLGLFIRYRQSSR